MPVKTGQAVTVEFTTSNPTTGAAADATGTPTGTLYVNGTANAAAVTVTNQATGVYKAAVTLPTLTAGDIVAIRISATVATIAGEGIVWQDTGDTVYVSDVSAAVVTGVASTLQATANAQTTGTLVSGTYASTYLSNGTSWVTAPVTPAVAESGSALSPFGLNVNLLFTAGATQTVNSVSIRGNFAAGSGRYTNVYAYNYSTSSWDMLSDTGTRMNTTGTLTSYTYPLLAAHQKPDAGGDGQGAIRIGFKSPSTNTGDRLNVDLCLVNVATANPSTADIADAVYAKLSTSVYGREVWIDTVNGVDGYGIGVNGLDTTPVLTLACAYQLCDTLGLRSIAFKSGSNAVAVTLTRSAANWRFTGPGKIDLAGYSIADTIFEDVYSVYGSSTGDDATFNECQIGSGGLTLDHSYVRGCRIKGAITLIANAEPTIFQSCIDATGAGADFELIFVATATAVVRSFQGGITLKSMATGNSVVIDGACRVTIDASCTGGSITLRGFADAPDGAAAFVAAGGTITQTARYATDQAMGVNWANVTGQTSTVALTNTSINDVTLGAKDSTVSKPGTAQTITANQAVNAAQWGGAALPTIPGAAPDAAAIEAAALAAIVSVNLDHVVGTATGIPAVPAGTFLDQIMDDGTATYDRTTDSLQAVRDNQQTAAAAAITAAGLGTPKNLSTEITVIGAG